MAKTSPMVRTLSVLKKENLKYWRVEVWQHWSKRRVDLFNIIDLLVLDGTILGIQVCSGGDYRAHVRKLMEQEAENTRAWLESNGRLEIWAWRKLKVKRGGKAMKWIPKIADVLIVNGGLFLEERQA